MTNEQALNLVLHAARDKARIMEVERRHDWKDRSQQLWEAIEQVDLLVSGDVRDPRWGL